MDEGFFSITDAARVTGVSRWTLARKVADGLLPSYSREVNRRKVYVKRADLDALFTAVRRSTPARVEVGR